MIFSLIPLHLLFLFVAGCIGALARFTIVELITIFYDKTSKFPFPHHTFAVNVIAGFLMGLFASILKFTPPLTNTLLETILLTGFLGAFSTFSTYIADIADHLMQKKYWFSLFYSLGTIFFTLAAGMLGRLIGGAFIW